LKATVLALLMLVVGCGGNTDSRRCAPDCEVGAGSTDLSAIPVFDFAGVGTVGGTCSASTVQASCATGTECVACLSLGTSGVCVQPCKLDAPDCPSGTSCGSFGDGGASDLVFGGSCSGYDGICQ
jgi:hypothetical protein